MIKYYSIIQRTLVILCIIGVSYMLYDFYKYYQFVERVNAINDRIDYLHKVKGYDILEAKHITDVEFGITPADPEYNALIKEQK